MILYLDTSALVKAYVDEDGSDAVLELLKAADMVAAHEIAYVEARATYARLARESRLTQSELEQIKADFDLDWENYAVVHSDAALLRRAADMAEAFALRAYDSVHLAAAEYLASSIGERVTFLCFDRKLCQAASVLRLQLVADSSVDR